MKNSRPLFTEISPLASFLIWSGNNKNRPAFLRYGVAIVLVTVATILKLYFFNYVSLNTPYILYFAVVCLCTILAGIWPAILAAVLSAIAGDYFFIQPYGEFSFNSVAVFKTFVFFCECTFLIILSSAVTNAYRQMSQNQLLFKAMIEQGSEGIVLTSRDGKRTYVSASIERIIGYTASEFQNMEPWALAHPDEIANIKEKMSDLMANPGKNISFVHRIRHKDGRWLWLENSITNLLDNEAIGAVVANFYNVTERVMLEQKKDDFIGIASHELKTPITTLKASIQLLDKIKDNPSQGIMPKLIEQCKRSVEKMTDLVNELLDTSQISQGQLRLNKTHFIMAELLANCCTHVRATDKHNLVIQGDEQLPVYADESRIDQVVVNLVNNAVKYAPSSRDIILTVEKTGNNATVSVKDFGPGISPDKLPYIFERYYRAEHNNYLSSGLGLGLYISSEIIKRHGGQMGVISEPGNGSTFWFTLPLTLLNHLD